MTPQPPERYGQCEVVLMVVHPFLLFSYWEAPPESCRQAYDALGPEMDGARAMLRMYDISLINFDGTNAHHSFDIDVGLEARGWYIPVWTAEKSYCADLGFLARTGRFHTIVRSNVIHTPRAAPSSRTDEQWMRVPFTRRRKPDPRTLEYVDAPAYSRQPPTGQGTESQRTHDRLAESVSAYLAGGAPTSRQGHP